MKSVSWNQVAEDIRSMWGVYWSIVDSIKRKECEKAIYAVTDTVIRMHGMIPEEVTNRQ